MKTRILTGLLFCSLLLLQCAPSHSISIIYGDSYDSEKDITKIRMLPLGGVDLPGRWTRTSYNQVSRQYYFSNADSVSFAVAINPWDRYEFYKAAMTPNELVNSFYEWESSYFLQQGGGKRQVLRKDTTQNMILWNIRQDPDVNVYFLYGSRQRTAYNLSLTNPKWNEAEAIQFLESIYRK